MTPHELKSLADAQFDRAQHRKTLRETAYAAKFVPHNGGLFLAQSDLIAFLCVWQDESLIIEDHYQNPILVNRTKLLDDLKHSYSKAMKDWHEQFEASNRIRRGANV